jgi:DNA repair exonuclease SbcCD nuclease subunit
LFMVKILLTSDIHFGADIENTPVSEEHRLKTFRKLIYLARSHNLLLIAGDLFHNNEINEYLINIIKTEFQSLRESGVEIIITPGENEFTENPALLSGLNASKIFSDPDDLSPFKFTGEDQNIYIYGLPAADMRNISGIKKKPGNGFHIGLFHTDFYLNEGKSSNVRVLSKEDIAGLKLDFYALGHNHQFKLFKSGGRYIGAYPGSPEAVTYSETGDRYSLSLSIKDDEIFQIKRLTVNSVKLQNIVLDCSLFDSPGSMLQTLDEKKSADTIIKLLMTGRRNFKLDPDEISSFEKECLKLIIEDKSIPAIELFTTDFAEEKSLRGEFFSILDEKMKSKSIPADIDLNILSELLDKVVNSGLYTLEDLCSYWNA